MGPPAETSAASPPDPLWRQTAVGYRATLLTQSARILCKVVSVVALARLVSPEDHGRFAMAATVFGLFSLFRDWGLGTATVQARSLDAIQSTTLCWVNIVLGVAVGAGCFLSAPLAARFYAAPIDDLVRAMSLAFVLLGVGGFVRPRLYRELQFAQANAIETVSVVVGTAAMLGVGLAGGGAWAFVTFLLVSEFVSTALAWRAQTWRPAGRPRLGSLRELLRTGGAVTVHNAIAFALQQVDTIAIGRLFGSRALGVYNRANQIIALPNLYVAAPLGQVLLASLSRASGDSSARHQARGVNGIGHLVLPLFAVPIVLPAETVRLVLGPQWPEAVALMPVLAVAGAAAAISSMAYAVNVAAGRADRLVSAGLATLPVIAGAIWVGASRGVYGIAASIAAANVLLLVPRSWWLLRGMPGGFAAFYGALIGPVISLALAALGLAAATAAFGNVHWAIRLTVGLAGALATLGLAALVSARLRNEWRSAGELIPRRFLPPQAGDRSS